MEYYQFHSGMLRNFAEDKFYLNNGMPIPAIGFGTYQITEHDDIQQAVDCALHAGYRLFDTAAVYMNEGHLGRAFKDFLPKYGLTRDDIFVTTKLGPFDYGKDRAPIALQKSLNHLQLEYVDMYLIHFPGAARMRADHPMNLELRHETWDTLIEMYEQGLVRSIGVSNFTVNHLEKLKLHSPIKPVLNQVEWHPYYYQPELLKYCQENSILLQAYSSLGGASKGQRNLLEEPLVKSLARKHKLNEGQILLLWALQQGIPVIPKSVTPHNIRNNIDLYGRLTDGDMQALNSLNRKVKYGWDPTPVIH